jgi:hypothetical protein
MKKLLLHLMHGLTLMVLALGVFGLSFIYENDFVQTVVLKSDKQVLLSVDDGVLLELNRGEDLSEIANNAIVEVGDVVYTDEVTNVIFRFAGDGELRLDKQTRVSLVRMDTEKLQYTFKLMEGRGWLVNSYSNADVVLLLDGAAVFPGQSVVMVKQESEKAKVYVHAQNTDLGITSTDIQGTEELTINSPEVINKLYLPQGTAATVFAKKVRDNQETIKKLLFSKMVKEFQYSIFNKNELITDIWLVNNVSEDIKMTAKIRDERLKKIRTRGLKYSSLDASNYQVDGAVKDFYNVLTFSDKRVGQRNLEALYDLLYDSQYLFDYGRTEEAEERLESFTTFANQLFLVYGDDLKQTYIERVKEEYEYLSFANPSDSLFGLKQVLQGIYLDSVKGQVEEVDMKFRFLTEDLLTLGYHAANNNVADIDEIFTSYMDAFKDLNVIYGEVLKQNPDLIQRQNQGLNNVFVQNSSMYRQTFFTNKLFVENKYLSLLPASENKYEEIQNIILQRIDFLSRLENYYLNGDVPLVDAQNILTLLFSEISKIELPDTYQVAIKQLFDERIEDFGVFFRFLSSQEYVSSSVRGATPRERFEQFKKDNKDLVQSNIMNTEIMEKAAEVGNIYELGKIVDETETKPIINEEIIEVEIDSEVTIKENEVVIPPVDEVEKPKVPRVRPSN